MAGRLYPPVGCARVRIALTHAFCWPEVRRGGERFQAALGAALARRGHEVVQFSAAWKPTRGTVDGVATVQLRRRFEHPYRHEADFGWRLLPRLATARFDAVHSLGRHDALASIRAARLHPRRRTVMTDLGLPDRDWWRGQGRRESRAMRKAVAGIDVYAGLSKCALEYLVRNYGREDGAVLPGGVDLRTFVPAPSREPKPTLLFSGAITEPRKGVATLLEALPIVARSEPDAQLWLSGPGDPDGPLAAADPSARERTRALGLGDAAAQEERYGRAWVTCLPSTHEAFGLVLLESLACGTPVVATTHSAPKELVDEGVTGELCQPGDVQGLAEACLRALHLARRPETVEACRTSARAFDWDEGIAPLAERLYAGAR
jgi:glycosyltransferase involved in cell wall biosynthesis